MTTSIQLGLGLVAESESPTPPSLARTLSALGLAPRVVVEATARTSPPASPTFGQRFLVGASATGLFAGRDGQVAVWADEWLFLLPQEGWTLWDGSVAYVRDGSSWVASSGLLAANNLSDLASASTARTNLGLGSLATQSGTFSGTHSGTSSGTNTGDQTVTLTGDVTGTGTGSFAATIGANKVTDVMLRDSAAVSVLGRSANSSGDPADIAAAADGSMLERYNAVVGFQAHAGTSFPASPYNGMRFVRTDLEYWTFVYDGGRTAWLSVQTVEYAFTSQNSVSVGSYFRAYQGPVGTDTLGPTLPWTAVLVETVQWKNDNTTAGNADVRENANSKYTATLASGSLVGSATGLNVSFAASAVVSVKAVTTTWTGGGGVIARFRRVAT